MQNCGFRRLCSGSRRRPETGDAPPGSANHNSYCHWRRPRQAANVCRQRGDREAALHVLLIEDDDQIAAAIAVVLAREDIGIERVGTAEAGLRRAGATGIDVVIMDWMLPGLSGIDAVARLRDAGIEKPVLMLSALGRAQHRVEGLDRGADDYLAKPFEPVELVARLRALYRRTRAVSGRRESRGFPRVQFSDSGFMLMKEVGMDGSRAFTGSS